MTLETVYLLARVLTCGIWVTAGLYKMTHFQATVNEMISMDVPLPRLALPIVLVMELMGSALLVVDHYVWAVSVVWLIFMIPASYLYHFRFMLKDGAIVFVQMVLGWKNVSIAGGLIALIILDESTPAWLLANP